MTCLATLRIGIAGRLLLVAWGLGGLAGPAAAQSGAWRLGASAGGYLPRSALVKAQDQRHTRLDPGPGFALDLQYRASSSVSGYGSALGAAGTITLGSSIQPEVAGPSNQVLVVGGTAGVVLSLADAGPLTPTLRLGGGLKGYVFDLEGARNQWRPTADIGLGFRGGSGPVEVTAELRYLPSSFDQARLPTRGITPQKQRQNDFFFGIGVAVRP